jgi:hypothetical protein
MAFLRTAPPRALAVLLAVAGLLAAGATLSSAHAYPIEGEPGRTACLVVEDSGGLPSAGLAGTRLADGTDRAQALADQRLSGPQVLAAAAASNAAALTAAPLPKDKRHVVTLRIDPKKKEVTRKDKCTENTYQSFEDGTKRFIVGVNFKDFKSSECAVGEIEILIPGGTPLRISETDLLDTDTFWLKFEVDKVTNPFLVKVTIFCEK